MKCTNPNCLHEIPDDSIFCPDCGERIIEKIEYSISALLKIGNITLGESNIYQTNANTWKDNDSEFGNKAVIRTKVDGVIYTALSRNKKIFAFSIIDIKQYEFPEIWSNFGIDKNNLLSSMERFLCEKDFDWEDLCNDEGTPLGYAFKKINTESYLVFVISNNDLVIALIDEAQKTSLYSYLLQSICDENDDKTIEHPSCPSCRSNNVDNDGSDYLQYRCNDCGHNWGHDDTVGCPECGSHDVENDGTDNLQYKCNNCGHIWGDNDEEEDSKDEDSPTCPECGSNDVEDDDSGYLQYTCNDCGHNWGHDDTVGCPECGSHDVENDGTDNLQYKCNNCGHIWGDNDEEKDSKDEDSPTCPECGSNDVEDDDSGYLQYTCNDCGHNWGHDDTVGCPECGSDDVENDGTDNLQYKCNNCGHIWGDNDKEELFDKLFPICGITLGKTTVDDIKYKNFHFAEVEYCESGSVIAWTKDRDGSKGAQIRQEPNDECFTRIYFTRYNDMFEKWKQLGFCWSLSYDRWVSLFKELGFKIEVEKYPSTSYYQERNCFAASFYATSKDSHLIFELNFNYGNDKGEGYTTTSRNSLYCITLSISDNTCEW